MKKMKKKYQFGGNPADMKQYKDYEAKAKNMGMTNPDDQRFYARQQMRANPRPPAPAPKMQEGGKTKAGKFIQDVANAAKSLKRTPAQTEARANLIRAKAERAAARRGKVTYNTVTAENRKKGGSMKKMQDGGPMSDSTASKVKDYMRQKGLIGDYKKRDTPSDSTMVNKFKKPITKDSNMKPMPKFRKKGGSTKSKKK